MERINSCGQEYVFEVGDFPHTGEGIPSGWDLLKLTIVPSTGIMEIDGSTYIPNNSISYADIVAGKLIYYPDMTVHSSSTLILDFLLSNDNGVNWG